LKDELGDLIEECDDLGNLLLNKEFKPKIYTKTLNNKIYYIQLESNIYFDNNNYKYYKNKYLKLYI
jgi:hypothetical protein